MQYSQLIDGINRVDRRDFCKAVGVATAVGVAGASFGTVLAHADFTKEQRDKMTPDEVIPHMKAGNERFRSGKPKHRDLMSEAKATAKGQYPAAIVFSCIDSRAPAELILDFGIGDIFSGRWAGKVCAQDTLERSAKNYAVVDAVGRKNVSLTIANIREKSSVLRELESSGSIKIVSSMYNLETGVVEFFA